MNLRRFALLPWLCLAVAGCATMQPRGMPAPSPVQAAQQQILVMLHAPPLHFRPDAGYTAGYDMARGDTARRRLGERVARQYGLRLLDAWPMPALGVDCLLMELPSGASATLLLRQVSADPRVAWAQPLHVYRTLGDDDPLYPLQPAASRWRLSELHAVATGRDVVVAQLDTGVDLAHPDLRGQIAEARNFVDDGAVPAEAHGTEVAGIIAARAGNGIGIAGIAPDARLLALRACWQLPGADGAAACSSFTLAKALQFALLQHAQVLNLSLTGPPDVLLERLLDAAMARGVTVVGAADAHAPDGGFPASLDGVLAVAGDPIDGHAHVWLAPARDIPTTTPGGGWGLVSGSSFAAAEVSGLVALLRQLGPRMSAAQLRDALAARTALGLGPERSKPIDACAAVVQAAGRCACDCAAPDTGVGMPRR
ncbi:MAG TPA: S8 family serine peptidase [Mizugakiibacter sp.]